ECLIFRYFKKLIPVTVLQYSEESFGMVLCLANPGITIGVEVHQTMSLAAADLLLGGVDNQDCIAYGFEVVCYFLNGDGIHIRTAFQALKSAPQGPASVNGSCSTARAQACQSRSHHSVGLCVLLTQTKVV